MNALFREGSKSCRRFGGAPGQTFRIGTQAHAQSVLRRFMLLWVAGEHPTTKIQAKSPVHVTGLFAFWFGCSIWASCRHFLIALTCRPAMKCIGNIRWA